MRLAPSVPLTTPISWPAPNSSFNTVSSRGRTSTCFHGLLADLFDGKIGMILFGNTRWGANAGLSLLVDPANWIVLYCFAAYFCRKNRLLLVGLTVAIACGLVQGNSPRFLLLPIFLITFDAVLRQPTWRRCWLFMATLVIGIMVTPEQVIFAPCLLIPLVLFEAAGRSREQSISTSFPRTWRCAIAGAALSLAWFILLAGTGSLLAFFDYFRVFSSGYGLEGRVPTQWALTTQLMATFAWGIPLVLWLATLWRVATKLRLRQVWAVTDWVMVAAAAMSAIYYPQALDRADIAHVYQSFWVSVPLLILWSIEVLTVADRAFRSALRRLATKGSAFQVIGIPQLRHVATFAALVAVIAGTTGQVHTIPFVLPRGPNQISSAVPIDAQSAVPRLGYTVPGSVDTAQISELETMLDRYAGPTRSGIRLLERARHRLLPPQPDSWNPLYPRGRSADTVGTTGGRCRIAEEPTACGHLQQRHVRPVDVRRYSPGVALLCRQHVPVRPLPAASGRPRTAAAAAKRSLRLSTTGATWVPHH